MIINDASYSVYVHIAPNNKLYFGITSQCPVKNRWGSNGIGYIGTLFWRAIQKYGWDNFQHIILLDNLTADVCSVRVRKIFDC